MRVTAKKLITAPNDVNKVASQANQDAVTISQSGNNIVIRGDLSQLNSFNSTDPNQGSGKWIGVDLDTNLDTIVGAKWNGYTLAQADADEAASVGLGAGQIIFWVKAESISSVARAITIGAEGKEDVVITVSFEDTGI